MQVFISHTASDRDLAGKLARKLTEHGLSPWWGDQVLPGDNWAEAVGKALEASDALVVILSADAVPSQFVKRDVEFVLGRKRFKDRVITILPESLDAMDTSAFWVLSRGKRLDLYAYEDKDAALGQVVDWLKQETAV